jgi:hypothetical protein
MKIFDSAKLLLFAAAFTLSVNPTAYAQEKQTYRAFPVETYKKIVDLLFPLDALEEHQLGFVLVLRFMPSFEAESQIVIVGREGSVQITEYESLDGNIYIKANEILKKTGQNDPSEVAKMIRIGKRQLKIPTYQVLRWRRNLIKSVGLALQPKNSETVTRPYIVTVIDDPTGYNLWDSSMAGDVYYSTSSILIANRPYPGRDGFIRWMKTVEQEVSKLK